MIVLIVGGGSIGLRHATNALRDGHEVTIHEPSSAQRARACIALQSQIGLAQTTWTMCSSADPAEILSDRYDRIIVCTPAATRLNYLPHLLRQNVRMLVEKPFMPYQETEHATLWPLDHVSTGYQLRFHPDIQAMKRLRPTSVDVSCLCNMEEWPGSAKDGEWLGELSHEIELAHYFGATEVVDAQINDEMKTARLRFNNGSRVSLSGRSQTYARRWVGYRHGYTIHETSFTHPSALGTAMYRDELRSFTTDAGVPCCSAKEGMTVLQTIAEARRIAQ